MRVTISLREDDVKAADEQAEEMGLTRSALIRVALLDYLRKAQQNKEE